MANEKRPLTAGILSFILPGLGLLYLGYTKAALINFALVNMALIVFTVFFADPTIVEYVHYLFLGFAALSAGYAHGVASTKHKETREIPQGNNTSVAA